MRTVFGRRGEFDKTYSISLVVDGDVGWGGGVVRKVPSNHFKYIFSLWRGSILLVSQTDLVVHVQLGCCCYQLLKRSTFLNQSAVTENLECDVKND